jgi:predicted phage terminase large subunit-like protein
MSNLQIEQAKRELFKRTIGERGAFENYVKFMFKHELNKEFKKAPFHQPLFKHLQDVQKGKLTRLIVNIPPNSGKTTLITQLFPTWCMGLDPTTQIIGTGYSADLTSKFSGQARNWYKSDAYFKVFPYRSNVLKDLDTRDNWGNVRGGYYKADGTDGTITGFHSHLFLIDDPLKPQDAKSDKERERVNQWFDNVVLSRLINQETSAIILVMQRLHEDDLSGHLLKKVDADGKPIWTHLNIAAIGEGGDDWRKPGESFYPDKLPIHSLQAIKQNDPIAFETQYQQNPISALEQEFFPEFFKHYNGHDEINLNKARIFTVVDPAFSQRKDADFTCVMTGAYIDEKLYILEYHNHRYNATQLIDSVIYHAKKWKPEKIGVENVAAQVLLKQQIESEFRRLGIYRTIVDVKSRENKENRIRDLERLIRHGQIIWKKDMTELELQFRQFPRAKHDDIIDCITLLRMLHNPVSTNKYGFNFEFKYSSTGKPMF